VPLAPVKEEEDVKEKDDEEEEEEEEETIRGDKVRREEERDDNEDCVDCLACLAEKDSMEDQLPVMQEGANEEKVMMMALRASREQPYTAVPSTASGATSSRAAAIPIMCSFSTATSLG
jgi:hypothetical protein